VELEVRALILDKQRDAAIALNSALLPEIICGDLTVRPSLRKGIEALKDGNYDMALISEGFNDADLQAFFSDLKALKKDQECLVVEVRESLEDGFDRHSVVEMGYATVITRKSTEADKTVLIDKLTSFLQARTMRHKHIDVDVAVKLLVLEIDRVSRNRKRGIMQGLNRDMVSIFMSEQLGFHDEILMGYLEALERYTSESKPDKDVVTALPEKLLAKELPGVKDGQYVGVSLRVWDMLRDRFGVAGQPDASETQAKPENPAAPEAKPG